MSDNHIDKVHKEINEISPSFCVAKWKQVTMHLQNGHTHSCHHPATHHVPVSEIKINSTALHNSEFKKQQRKLMLEGKRPRECDYCWNVEDTNQHYSDRTFKSADESWAYPYIDEIVNKPWNANIDPSYVEVSFGNVCNFKCSYCAPQISSQWMEEIERYGAYPTSNQFNNLEWLKLTEAMPIPNNKENPYVDAFWNWFPDMYKSLKYFRITGGEPLLNKNTFKVLDYIIANPNTDLEVAINTNMNAPDELMNKFIEKVKIIMDEKKLKRFKLFTSAEAHGKASEYIRYGMNYNDWINNMHKMYKAIPGIQFTIMSTYNLLSVTSYTEFLKDILLFKQEYGTTTHYPMLLDIPYLRYPLHQSVFIMEQEQLDLMQSQIDFMDSNIVPNNMSHQAFYPEEVERLKRIQTLIKSHIDDPKPWFDTSRKDFIIFVNEHDRRRGSNFLETFPELTNMYNRWSNL